MFAVLVSLAAGVGAVARYVVDLAVQRRWRGTFPVGTLVVNMSGSLVAGLIAGLSLHHGLQSRLATVLAVGFAGGYTTFSTLIWETLALGEVGAGGEAAANVVGSFAIGFVAAAAGLGLGLL
jgi:CrcB protein